MPEEIKVIIIAFLVFDIVVAFFFYVTYIRDAKAKQIKALEKEREETEEDDFEEMMKKIMEEDRKLKEEEAKKEQEKKEQKKA